jgi:hypothetical protein
MPAIFPDLVRLQNLLLAAEPAVDESMKTDPAALPIISVIALAVPIALFGRYRYGRGLRIFLGILFGLIDFGITTPVMLAGIKGVSTPVALAVGLGAGALVAFIIIAFGAKVGSWVGKHEVAPPRQR